MSDPNSLGIIIEEFKHLHDDIHQIGWLVIVVGIIVFTKSVSKCGYKERTAKES